MRGHELGSAMRSSAKQKETKMRDVPQAEEAENKSHRRVFQEYSEAFVVAVILAILIRALLFQAFQIPSGSMEHTLEIGDHILVNKFIYGIRIPFTKDRWPVFTQPRRGDVIVFVYPKERAKDFIKRVVGVAGDTVEVRDKRLIVNGKPDENPYAHNDDKDRILPPNLPSVSERDHMEPTKVPEGALFVMGDNRDHSSDSRFWGFVPVEDVKGKAFIIYYSGQGLGAVRWDRFFKLIPQLSS
jgi:signal peptidase I